MPPVEPTPEYDLAVVPYRPYYGWVKAIVTLLVSLSLAAASYFVGHYYGAQTEQSAIVERDRLQAVYSESEKTIKQLEQKVANLRLGSEVDRKAVEQVRSRVVELNNKIAELERDNSFYRDLMRPDSDDKGISISSPSLALSAGSANTYDYKMVVKQQAANRLQVVGYLEFEVVGKDENGKSQRFDLHEVSQVESLEKIKLNFRYFQRLEGSMVLPETFTPERIELKVVSFKPKKALIEKQFNWVIKES